MILVQKTAGFYSWISLAVTLANVISTSSQMNETNTTTTATPGVSTTPSSGGDPPPPNPSCIDKKVWNVCWSKTPPYIFERPSNKSIIEGILADAIIKGLTKCGCQANLNYTLHVYEEEDLVNCSTNQDIDLIVPFPRKGITKFNSFFKIVDSAAIYLLLNRNKIESQAKANIIYEFSQVWTLAVLTILLAAIFGIIVWSLVSWEYFMYYLRSYFSKQIYITYLCLRFLFMDFFLRVEKISWSLKCALFNLIFSDDSAQIVLSE